MPFSDFVLLTPKNDEESLMIVRIAEAAKIPMVVSAQPHGAKLEREPAVLDRLRKANPAARRVVIVEIPGPETEGVLREAGYDVAVIDHHRYTELDRMTDKSSLEQFLEMFGIDEAMLATLGFDPVLVRGVGIIDRGFLWALRNEIPDVETRKRIRDFYRSLALELGKDRARIEEAAQEAWEHREVRDGVVIVRTDRNDVSIRDAVSFLIADAYDAPPQSIVVEGTRRLFVQESDHAAALFQEYGGFTFGRDRCWGIQGTPEKPLPAVDEILAKVA
ncbi:hypothetical protein HYS28_03170 [Candidatus Uhrbacteria bacterium]|nr:hypothetical protein [Candidatus Uhrbacteria bacterium]